MESGPRPRRPRQLAPRSALHAELVRSRIAELRARIAAGGVREAVTRALLYAGMSRQAVDERGFESIRRIRRAQENMPALALSQFKALVREQFYMLLIDEDASLAAISSMLPPTLRSAARPSNLVKEILSARGEITAADTERLERVAKLFDIGADRHSLSHPLRAPFAVRDEVLVKAS